MTTIDIALCVDCVLALAGYDDHELGHTPDRPPLALVDTTYLAGCTDGDNGEPCCEHWFSWSPCDGCGSRLGGDRYHHILPSR